jgi:thymidylate kinase
MKNIIFIEGVSGVGKTTTVTLLAKKLQDLGYSVSYHLEGEPDSPLDLCWVAYMSKSEYEIILNTYTDFTKKLSSNITSIGDDIILHYKVGETKLYSLELYNVLSKHEFCYKPT